MTYAPYIAGALAFICFLYLLACLRDLTTEIRIARREVAKLRGFVSEGSFYISTDTQELPADAWVAIRWKRNPHVEMPDDW